MTGSRRVTAPLGAWLTAPAGTPQGDPIRGAGQSDGERMPTPARPTRRDELASFVGTDAPGRETDRRSRRGWGPRREDAASAMPEERASGGLPGDKALASVIEGDVIPRLVQAHRPEGLSARRTVGAVGPPQPQPQGQAARVQRPFRSGRPGHSGRSEGRRIGSDVRAGDVEALFQCLLRDDPQGAAALLERRRAAGESVEGLCADLLGPVGQLLEVRWAADACGLTELTLGMGHLLGLLHDLEQADVAGVPWQGVERRVLVAAAPGERHAFGLGMLATVFQRAGWDVVDTVMSESLAEVARRLAEEESGDGAGSMPVLVLWAGTLARGSDLSAGLAALRQAMAAAPLRIVLAGPGVRTLMAGGEKIGDAAPVYGADAMAETAPEAVEQAACLLGPGGD